MSNINISITDVECHLPEKVITNDFFGESEKREKSKMFAGSKERRHMEHDELASDHITICCKKIIENHNIDPEKDIDMILTNVSYPDEPFSGCGAVVAKKIGAKVNYIFDLHNTGCISFINMLDLVKTHMIAKDVKSALICTSQTTGGRIFGQEDNRSRAQSSIPGDGTAVAYITRSEINQVTHLSLKNFPEYSEDMFTHFSGSKKWWDGNRETGCVDFTEERASDILMRGNRLVPKMIYEICKTAKIKTTDIDYLITNQPNPIFLRNWREAAMLPEEKHLNTFEKYANLFGAGIPISLAENIRKGTFKNGDIICLAGFAHAGDYASSALLKWG